jgi:putative DNA primase/helicase
LPSYLNDESRPGIQNSQQNLHRIRARRLGAPSDHSSIALGLAEEGLLVASQIAGQSPAKTQPIRTLEWGSASLTVRPELTSSEVSVYYGIRLSDLKRHGPQWRGPCPIHRGDDDNFAVDPEAGTWFCHSQCGRGGDVFSLEAALNGIDAASARNAVLALVGRVITDGTGLRPQNRWGLPEHSWRFLEQRIQDFAQTKALRHICDYYYTDLDGHLSWVKARFSDRQGKKTFQKYALTRKGGWTTPKQLKIRPLLYHLHLLAKAEEIHLCNGEKAADAGERLGLTTTCAPDGEAHWDPRFTPLLEGKRVFAYLDNDEKGEAHGRLLASSLIGQTSELRLVALPNLPPKGDLFDWIEAGGTVSELRKILNAVPALIRRDEEPPAERPWLEPSATKAEAPEGPFLRGPFRLRSDAVVYINPASDDEPFPICGRLEVVAKTRSKESEDWGRLLRWHDDDGVEHTWAMPLSSLQGDGAACRERLASGGLFIAPGSKARNLLNNYLQSAETSARARCVSRVGWHGDSFVLPGKTIGPAHEETVLFQTEHDSEHLLAVVSTVNDWREKVGRFCSGNTRLILAASCSFAGPCLTLLGCEPGGIHFHGTTSTGKSTALAVGGSVCGGGGRNGFVSSWRTTMNGLEAIAELHNDLALFLDELAQVPREAADTAYLLGNGMGKTRATRIIGTRRKPSWNLLFVSAGEMTLADHALTAGKRTKGGAEVRLLNVEADAGAGMGIFENIHNVESPDAFSRFLKDAAKRCYGAPLCFFLEFVTRNRSAVETTLRDVQAEFLKRHVPACAAGEVFRAAARFAVIAAAGELATGAEITGWQEGEAINSAARCFESWLERRGTTGSSDIEEGIKQVRSFIEANGSSRFQSCQPRPGKSGTIEKVVERVGFRSELIDGKSEYYILPEAFKNQVCAEFDPLAVARALKHRGFLITEPGRHLTIRKTLPEFGKQRVYAVRSSLCGGDD